MTRCERTVRDTPGRPGRRPGNGIRSAMLLSGFTTIVSPMTASCSVAMAGVQRLHPGRKPAQGVGDGRQLLERPVAGGQLIDQAAFGQQAIGEPVLGEQPVDQPVLGHQLIRQSARASERAPVRRPRQSAGRAGRRRAVSMSTTPPGRIRRSIGPSAAMRAPERCVVVQQSGQPVGSLIASSMPSMCATALGPPVVPASPRVRCAMPNAPTSQYPPPHRRRRVRPELARWRGRPALAEIHPSESYPGHAKSRGGWPPIGHATNSQRATQPASRVSSAG